MIWKPQELLVQLVSMRSQLDQAIILFHDLFIGKGTSPAGPPLAIRLRPVVRLVEGKRKGRDTTSPLKESHSAKSKQARPRPAVYEGLVAWEAVEKFLISRGSPAKTAEIAAALARDGFKSTAKSLRSFLFQVMRKKPRVFSRPGRGLWGLTAWDD